MSSAFVLDSSFPQFLWRDSGRGGHPSFWLMSLSESGSVKPSRGAEKELLRLSDRNSVMVCDASVSVDMEGQQLPVHVCAPPKPVRKGAPLLTEKLTAARRSLRQSWRPQSAGRFSRELKVLTHGPMARARGQTITTKTKRSLFLQDVPELCSKCDRSAPRCCRSLFGQVI